MAISGYSKIPRLGSFDVNIARRVVTDYVLLLGLDELYREAIKRHESGELLDCSRQVANALQVSPADDPVEGYYSESEPLKGYFLNMRALQQVSIERAGEVAEFHPFQRLLEVASSPIYGEAVRHEKLLPVGRDALSKALLKTQSNWSIQSLTEAAFDIARETDDYSLVGLAARAKNPIVLTALKESVVLYAELICDIEEPPPLEYVWQVDDELARQAARFVDTFNTLFDEKLPAPEAGQAEQYWLAQEDVDILGRCVRIGSSISDPPQNYHWAICLVEREYLVKEFWHPEIWTTLRYREAQRGTDQAPEL
jgi:hypothetical protein